MWPECCQLLLSLLDKMLANQETLEVVGAQLQHILASVLASLQSSALTLDQPLPSPTGPPGRSAAQVSAEEPLVRLILRLTVEAPPGLHVYLRDVEPLLPLPALDAACRSVLNKNRKQNLKLFFCLLYFCLRPSLNVWLACPNPNMPGPVSCFCLGGPAMQQICCHCLAWHAVVNAAARCLCRRSGGSCTASVFT